MRLVEALKQEQITQQEIAEQVEFDGAYAKSEEGRKYIETLTRLDSVRAFLCDRWDRLGFEALHNYERDYVYVWWMDAETTSGGFDQYFYNATGNCAFEALAALEAVNACQSLAILRDAIAVFNVVGGFEQDRARRQDRIARLPADAFEATTYRFYDSSEDLRSLALLRVEREYLNEGIYPNQNKF